MKHYRDNIGLIILNILTEYVLLVLTFVLCGLIRCKMPLAVSKPFSMTTAWRFMPFVAIASLLMIVIYCVMNDYASLHFRNIRRIFVETLLVHMAGGAFIAVLLFMAQGMQFSRWLLLMLVVAWTVVISLKRVVFSVVARKVFGNKLENYRVLVLGNNDIARRYIGNLIGKNSYGYVFSGYLAEKSADNIDKYLGGYDFLNEAIKEHNINRVVITEENLSRKFLGDVLSVCALYGISAQIVPAYSDYLSQGQSIIGEDGLHVINVNANNTSNILGVNISVTNMESTIADIVDNLEKWRGEYVCVSNVHTTVMAHDDARYRAVQNEAVMALPDGGPLSSYSRSTGKTDARRVTGPDLMRELLKRSKEHGWSHFFYGSSEKTLEMLKEKIERDYPGAKIVGMISPPYREISPEEDEEYVRIINEARPDFVWIGLGAPKQEIWMNAHKGRINALMFGVGAAFDYESGNLKRAPKWMQKCNLEWLYRLMQEPKRLFKRYFVTNIKFLWLTRR